MLNAEQDLYEKQIRLVFEHLLLIFNCMCQFSFRLNDKIEGDDVFIEEKTGKVWLCS